MVGASPPPTDYATSQVVIAKIFSTRNEAPLYCAALRSHAIVGVLGAASRVCDERQKTAPLTPLPALIGEVCLDNANVVIDGMTLHSFLVPKNSCHHVNNRAEALGYFPSVPTGRN